MTQKKKMVELSEEPSEILWGHYNTTYGGYMGNDLPVNVK